MNTRIQVEHTITEAVTGIDLVREQLLVAAGQPLSFGQDDIEVRGHAIECRINAEDAGGRLPALAGPHHALPRAGRARACASTRRWRRAARSCRSTTRWSAKLVVWDRDRDAARARMRRALDEYVVEGVHTLIPLHRLIMEAPEFARGETCAGLVEDVWPHQLPEAERAAQRRPTGDGALHARLHRPRSTAAGHEVRVHVPVDAAGAEVRRRIAERRHGAGHAAGAGSVTSPMQGTVLKVAVADGRRGRGRARCWRWSRR